jgi:hypothetical protein
MLRSLFFVTVTIALGTGGCSSSDAGKAAADGDGGAEGGGGPSDLDANGCHQNSGGIVPGTLCIRSVEAKVLDIDDKPVAGLTVSACGGVCVPATTAADGSVHLKAGYYFLNPGFLLALGRSRYAGYVTLLPPATSDVVFPSPFRIPRLPDAGESFPASGAAGSVSSAGLTLTLSAQTKVDVDSITFQTPDDQAFRAVAVPIERGPGFLDPSLGVELLYAVGPLETKLDPPAPLSLPNAKSWPAGAVVELLVHGYLKDEPGYGTMAKTATGRVSADGARIVTDDGQGITLLTWIGVRRAR